MNKLKIIYRDIDELKFLPKNFKRHALDEATESISINTFVDPIGRNPQTGHTFDGNGRIEALRIMRKRWLEDKTKPVPSGIEVKGDKWLAPSIDVEMDEDAEVRVAAALNEINRIGGYDEAFQLEVLQELQAKDKLTGTGFGEADLSALVKRFGGDKKPSNSNPDEDLANLSGAPDNSNGEKANAPTSTVKQVQLFFQPELHIEFMNLTMELAEPLGCDNVSDTVIEALRTVARQFTENNETASSEATA